jgi:hypothetical protein
MIERQQRLNGKMALAVIGVACLCATGVWAKDFRVYGKPPLGAFGIDTLEDVSAGARLGMTLVFSYSSESARKQLDLNSPTGQAIAAAKMQVMYPLAGRFTQVRLAGEVKPEDTTISVSAPDWSAVRAFPDAGVLMIEGERIEYKARTAEAFTGCVRGTGGTKPARHPVGLLICDSEGLKKEILAVKDSPNLWGYWLVDDAREMELDSLREMSRVVRENDRNAKGKPNPHIIVVGIGGMTAMANFDRDICDAIGVYLYPYHKGQLDAHTRAQMNYIYQRAKSLDSDVGIIGIYQAFIDEAPQWSQMPSPEQVHEDILSYYDYGAEGLLGYIWHLRRPGLDPWGFDAVPGVRDVVARTYAEIVAGKVKRDTPKVDRHDWLSIITGDKAAPSKGAPPLCDLTDAAKLTQLIKDCPRYTSAEAFSQAGQSYPLKVSFPAYTVGDPDGDRWPIAQFAGASLSDTAWTGTRALEQPIYNASGETLCLWITIEDTDGGEWTRSSVQIPPGTPVLLRVSLDEVRICVNLQKIKRWMLWESHPPRKAEFHLGSPVLAGKKR